MRKNRQLVRGLDVIRPRAAVLVRWLSTASTSTSTGQHRLSVAVPFSGDTVYSRSHVTTAEQPISCLGRARSGCHGYRGILASDWPLAQYPGGENRSTGRETPCRREIGIFRRHSAVSATLRKRHCIFTLGEVNDNICRFLGKTGAFLYVGLCGLVREPSQYKQM